MTNYTESNIIAYINMIVLMLINNKFACFNYNSNNDDIIQYVLNFNLPFVLF